MEMVEVPKPLMQALVKLLRRLEWGGVHWASPAEGYRLCPTCRGALSVKGPLASYWHKGHERHCDLVEAIRSVELYLEEPPDDD